MVSPHCVRLRCVDAAGCGSLPHLVTLLLATLVADEDAKQKCRQEPACCNGALYAQVKIYFWKMKHIDRGFETTVFGFLNSPPLPEARSH